MNITKYIHACLLLENDERKLLIDPGKFTQLPERLEGIETIVITDEHYDHFDLENVQKILTANRQAAIYATPEICRQLLEHSIECHAVDDTLTFDFAGEPVTLQAGDHAPVYGASPCRVITVKVGDKLYYPSDSFIPIAEAVSILAIPMSGPWYKLAEAVDFAKAVPHRHLLPTHDALSSDVGDEVTRSIASMHLPVSEWLQPEIGQPNDM